jgi:hypothetical protein
MAMYHNHILGPIVRQARSMRAGGASAGEVVAFLLRTTGKNDAYHLHDYLAEIFLQQKIAFMTTVSPRGINPAKEDVVARLMDQRQAEWLAQLGPTLPRARDYHAFLEIARDEKVIVTVCGFERESELLLHGVYDADSGQPAWSAKRGERLRGIINRRLGAELVRQGPHDDWEFRNDRHIAGSMYGPQAPTIEFTPAGDITNYVSWKDMARAWPYSRHWTRLYPNHPVSP